MLVFITLALTHLIVFVAGILVCRNNVKKVNSALTKSQDDLDLLKRDYYQLKDAYNKIKGQ